MPARPTLDDLPRLKKLRVQELRDELVALGIDASGTKVAMLERVQELCAATPPVDVAATALPDSDSVNTAAGASLDVPSTTRARSKSPQNRVASTRNASRSRSPAQRATKVVSDDAMDTTPDAHTADKPLTAAEATKKHSSAEVATLNGHASTHATSAPAVRNPTLSEKAPSTAANSTSGSKKKQRRKRRPVEKRQLEEPAQPDTVKDALKDVEIDYVAPTPELLGLSEESAGYQEFSRIFSVFTVPDEAVADVEPDSAEAKEANSSDEESDLEGEVETEEERISKKKQRKAARMSVAELKQLAAKPDVVEWVDVTAPDPLLLVHLKGMKNSVPVPVHWSQKRRYLAGKRGLEKGPFQLPDYIADTGIGAMREAVAEKDSEMTAKAKARAKTQPKMGKIEIDYQKLHDAFFRFQTKPHLSVHGDVYYEGKEFEIRLKEKKPGVLSDDLREALGMTSALVPPPWLINQQRYGPPPSYSNLKIPGLNAPIPEGAQWGFHPGGWGKPPVDEFNRPLYGDVFGLYQQYQQRLQSSIEAANLMNPVESGTWGAVEEVEYAPEEDQLEEEEEEEAEEDDTDNSQIDLQGLQTPSGFATPGGMASVTAGLVTPQVIELRKDRNRTGPAPVSTQSTDHLPKKQLYTVISQKETAVRGLMGSQHTYEIPTTTAPAPAPAGERKKRRFGATAEASMDISLAPEDLQNGLPSADQLREKLFVGKTELNLPKEDLSDMVAEHSSKQAAAAKKRKMDEASGTTKKRTKEFKF